MLGLKRTSSGKIHLCKTGPSDEPGTPTGAGDVKRGSKRGLAFKVIPFIAMTAIAIALVACVGEPSPASGGNTTANGSSYGDKTALTTADNTQAVSSEKWASIYPNEYNSMQLNANHDSTFSYLEQNDYLATVYEGTPFSKDYDKARGHTYCLQDVQATERIGEKTTADCYACKGSYFPTAELKDTDGSLYRTKFSDVPESELSPIGCYDCHLNSPGNATASRQYFVDAFPQASIQWGTANAACGQCHNEYYFDADTNAVMLPPQMTDPGEMLDYYNSIGFVDYTNPRTGTKQLKAQHPEVQMYAGSIHQQQGLTCADCHMERLTDVNGNTYTSHEIVNPLQSETIQQTVCSRCHTDVDAQLQLESQMSTNELQRETEVGEKLETLTNMLADAVNSGKYTEAELDQIRDLNRSAQWYWDFVFVENSNGYHNFELCAASLDKSEELCDQAIALMNK